MLVRGVDGEPDVGDDAGAFDVEQGGSGAGIEGDEVGVAAGAVPTGGAAAFVVAQAGHGDEGVGRWWWSGAVGSACFFGGGRRGGGIEAEESAGGGEGAEHFATGGSGGGFGVRRDCRRDFRWALRALL